MSLIIMRQAALNRLYFLKASIAYSEQLGINLHLGRITGDIRFL